MQIFSYYFGVYFLSHSSMVHLLESQDVLWDQINESINQNGNFLVVVTVQRGAQTQTFLNVGRFIVIDQIFQHVESVIDTFGTLDAVHVPQDWRQIVIVVVVEDGGSEQTARCPDGMHQVWVLLAGHHGQSATVANAPDNYAWIRCFQVCGNGSDKGGNIGQSLIDSQECQIIKRRCTANGGKVLKKLLTFFLLILCLRCWNVFAKVTMIGCGQSATQLTSNIVH